MKNLLPGVLASLLLLSGAVQVHALRLTDGLYFTVAPNSTGEVYFILPDDIGGGPGKADYFITTASNWSTDLTEETISTEENNTVITPIRFYSSDKKVGDCSNFTVTISAPSIQLSKKWKGGVCLSKYMDADISRKGGDAKSVLNENVDLFSAGFATYMKNAKPGEAVPVEILIQSQAGLTIDISLQSQASLDRKSFTVQTNQSSQHVSLMVNASADSPGNYDITMTAKARNCALDSCTRQGSLRLIVSDKPEEGFAISFFPENLAVKSLEPVQYRFTLQNNYGEERIFSVNIERPLDLDSSFISDYVTVPGLSEKSVDFNVTPRNQTGFYEIKAVAVSNGVEKYASAYLSTNEMVSDVYRNADDAKVNASASTKASVDKAVKSWYSSYSKSDGSNTTGFMSLQEALDAARKQNQSVTVPEEPSGNNSGMPEKSVEPSPNYLIYLLPVVLVGAVLVILLLLRKRKTGTENIKYLK